LDQRKITGTVLFRAEQAVRDLSSTVFINVMFWIQVVLSFFVPSSLGLAVLSMPIMAPLLLILVILITAMLSTGALQT